MKGIGSILKESYAKYDSFKDVPWVKLLKEMSCYNVYLVKPGVMRFDYGGEMFEIQDNGGEVHVILLKTSDTDVPYRFSRADVDADEEIQIQLLKQIMKLT